MVAAVTKTEVWTHRVKVVVVQTRTMAMTERVVMLNAVGRHLLVLKAGQWCYRAVSLAICQNSKKMN